MSTDLVALNDSREFTQEQVDLIKRTIAKGTTDDELALFLHACKRTGLDPLMKQLYAIKRWDAKLQREAMAIQTGIDGYRLIADRTGNYAPGQKPTFTYSGEELLSATAYVKKRTTDGTWHTVEAEAYYEEYVQTTKDGKVTAMWQKPHIMLAKCAESNALRRAFPAELSGIYTHEEMMQADNAPQPSLKPSDILKRSEQGTVHEPTVKEFEADLKKAQVMGVDASTGTPSSTRGMQDGSLPQSHDAPEPPSLVQDYISKAKLSQSVRECSEVGNAAEQDLLLPMEDLKAVRAVIKTRMQELGRKKA